MDKVHVMVIDDDPAISRLLASNLKARDYDVLVAMDGQQALHLIESEYVDLVILDLMLPKVDGVEICKRIREWSKVPIIVLSARCDEKDKIKCLELGADDYMTKPFGMGELLARVKNALRHTGKEDSVPASFVSGDLEINFAKRQVTVRGNEIKLTRTEYSLLQQLVANSNKVLTHSMLLKRIWGEGYDSEKEYLHVFIGRLRKKLEEDPDNPRYIITIPGVGYHFAESATV